MTTTIHFKKICRGPGYWKLYCSLIEIEEYKQAIKLLVRELCAKKKSYLSILNWWDDFKVNITAELQKLGAIESGMRKKVVKKLESEIEQERKKENPNIEHISEKRDELFEIQFPGVCVRAKKKYNRSRRKTI